MHPMIIAALTLIALAALVLEYFTRVFSRALAIARGQRSPERAGPSSARPMRAVGDGAQFGFLESTEVRAVPARPTDTPVLDSGFVSRPSPGDRQPGPDLHRIGFQPATVKRSDAARAPLAVMPPGTEPTMPPRQTLPAPIQDVPTPTRAPARPELPKAPSRASAHPPAPEVKAKATAKPEPARESSPTPVTPEARAATELMLTAELLAAVAEGLASDASMMTACNALGSLRDHAVDYDLDNLMAIPNDAHSREAIAFYRDALTIANEVERLKRRSAGTNLMDGAESPLHLELAALQSRLATAVALGMSLSKRVKAATGAAADELERERYCRPDSLSIPS